MIGAQNAAAALTRGIEASLNLLLGRWINVAE
jgi:hypothetical protein